MNEAKGRGGAQRIPRPSSFRPGAPAPWHGLEPSLRRLGLGEVRAACAALAPTPDDADAVEVPYGSRLAAVLMPLFEEDGHARMILTKRADSMPLHQGEIAFPGGKHEPGHDADLLATALRECEEEIGLSPRDVEVIGALAPHPTASRRFVVCPYVGVLAGRPTLEPDSREVDTVFDVALCELLDEGVFREELWEVPPELAPDGTTHRVIQFYELPGETVWGATARILTTFLAHLAASVSQRDVPGVTGVS